jgi:NAD-dependent SIR2 family protein deacetylase
MMRSSSQLIAMNDPRIERCWKELQRAERVLLAAGSGLSVDAGINYSDTAYFARRFPAMARRGFRMQYELIGYQGWSEALKWGFLADHVYAVRYETPPHPVYTKLLRLVDGKEYFIITSNVDGMFAKSGFAEERVYTPQGSYARYQCLKPCTSETWPLKPVIDRILPAIDPATQEITAPSLIPFCPNCGGPVFMNVRGGNWFVEEPYLEQRERFVEWVHESVSQPLLVLEIGSGFNTPGVIRWPMEQITYQHPDAHLVRVNRDHPQLPAELAGRATAIRSSAINVITALASRLDASAAPPPAPAS